MNWTFSDRELEELKAINHATFDHGPAPCMVYGREWPTRLIARLTAAEDVILDAEKNLGVVNPLLVNVWRDTACKEPTEL